MIVDYFKVADILTALIILHLTMLFSIWFYISEKQRSIPTWTKINIDPWVLPKKRARIDKKKFQDWLTKKR